MLGDVDRVRALFELATSQSALDMPELLWKSYIDFEFDEGERERTRALYERLLEKSKHLKIWLAYARFEMAKMSGAGEEEEEEEETGGDEGSPEKARVVYERAYAYFKADCHRKDVQDDIETFRKVKAQVRISFYLGVYALLTTERRELNLFSLHGNPSKMSMVRQILSSGLRKSTRTRNWLGSLPSLAGWRKVRLCS